MNLSLKTRQGFALAWLLLAVSLAATTDNPAAGDKAGGKNPSGQESKNLLSVTELDTAPVLITGKPPQYPRALRKAGVAGVVVVEFIINTSGDVIQAEVLESTRPEFELPALQSVQTWKFKPGIKDKRAVKVRMTERLEFEVPKK